MWDYASLIAKARLYLRRAESHPRTDDDEFGIWMLLGLEFLLRAPLAHIHPGLLAAPDGDSILHAVGIATSRDAKSVPVHTVIARLQHIVPNFDQERQNDATVLMNLRNVELHTGEPAIANAPIDLWLPRFLRVAEAICEHLGIQLTDLIGKEVLTQAQSLVDAHDRKVQEQVRRLINQAREFFQKLQPAEIESRRSAVPKFAMPGNRLVQCPSCKSDALLTAQYVRTTDERLEDDSICRDQILVAKSLECAVCGLRLQTTAETAAAGLPQQLTETHVETLEDRYMEAGVDWEYGNE